MFFSQSPPDDHHRTLQTLIEDLALKTEDLGKSLEGLQGLAEELALDASKELHPDALVRLQMLDSLTQRLFVLPRLLRCLKAAVPPELAMNDVQVLDLFATAMCSYQGADTARRPSREHEVGDWEIWKV